MAKGHTRRSFFKTTSAGVVGAAALGTSSLPARMHDESSDYWRELYERWLKRGAVPNPAGGLVITLASRYRTDPERIARMIPPPLEPDPSAEVVVNWVLLIDFPTTGNVFMPGPVYAESDIFVAATFEGHRGLLEVELQLDQDRGRYTGREWVDLHKKVGRVSIEHSGDRVYAWTTRKGMLLCALETVVTEEPAHPYYWHREFGYGWFKHSYRLHPDWRQGPIDEGSGVLIPRAGGRLAGYPTGMAEADPEVAAQVPRACDLKRTTIDTGELSPLNPFCEFPVREVLGVTFSMADHRPLLARKQVRIPRGQVDEQPPAPSSPLVTVDAAAFAPWALSMKGYDRAISDGVPWAPPGWPEETTAFKLTPAELDRYRSRETLALDPVQVVDLLVEIDSDAHRKTLPPVVTPGDRPLVRILGVSVERSDLSTRPYDELWLLASCELEGRPAWYPLDHVIGENGDVLFCREVRGYPSKWGEPELSFSPLHVAAQGRRLHRHFLDVNLPLSLDAIEPGEERLEMVGIQILRPQFDPVARWVASPWTLSLAEGRTADPGVAVLAFPTEPGPYDIGRTNPWFEFDRGKLVAAKAGRGSVRWHPGRVLRPFDGLDETRFLCPRLDGLSRPGARFQYHRPGVTPPVHTFLVADLDVKPPKGRRP
jgi:acetoacetate decarboxylase